MIHRFGEWSTVQRGHAQFVHLRRDTCNLSRSVVIPITRRRFQHPRQILQPAQRFDRTVESGGWFSHPKLWMAIRTMVTGIDHSNMVVGSSGSRTMIPIPHPPPRMDTPSCGNG